MKEIFVRLDRCQGCKSCEMACAVQHSASRNLYGAALEKPGSAWWCSFNFRWHAVDESKYHTVPAASRNTSSFQDFIHTIRCFNRRRVTVTREAPFVKFLSRCDTEHRDLYMSLFTKDFIKALPLIDVQIVLDLDSIEVQDIYGPIEILETSFADLQYPVAITATRDLGMPFYSYARGSSGSFSRKVDNGKFVRAAPLLQNDGRYIQTPKFCVTGFAQEYPTHTVFNPVDYFESGKEFLDYLKGKGGELPYHERIQRLRQFIANNLLTQISTNYIGLAFNEDEVLSEAVKVMEHCEHPYLCISDQNSTRTGKALAVQARVTFGIIDSFWAENGVPRGFMLWFNGKLFPCSFSFSGKNNALLTTIKPLVGKQLEFLYLTVGKSSVGCGRRILYDKALWRPRRVKQSTLWIEKCIFCGGTGNPHENRGLCKGCEPLLYQHYALNGPGVWITPSVPTKKRRHKAVWEPSLMNNARYRFKDCYLVAAENGDWKFQPDPEARKEFELWKKKLNKK